MIKFKSTVRLKAFSPAIRHILNTMQKYLYEFNLPYEGLLPKDVVITSINDGNHRPDSRHFTDEAIDVRSQNFQSRDAKLEFRRKLEWVLNWYGAAPFHDKFRVLFERTLKDKNGRVTRTEHFHIQVKKGVKLCLNI